MKNPTLVIGKSVALQILETTWAANARPVPSLNLIPPCFMRMTTLKAATFMAESGFPCLAMLGTSMKRSRLASPAVSTP